MYLTDKECSYLANEIKENLFHQKKISNKTSVFICGADINDTKTARYKLTLLLKEKIKKAYNKLEFIYPEDIFEELLYSDFSEDLLSLETLLAESVDVVLILPESPGSFAELGSFASLPALREKLICIINKRFIKQRSFINQGPLKLVKKENKANVIFLDYQNIEQDLDKILKQIRKLSKRYDENREINLLKADIFLLPLLSILEPIDKKSIIKIMEYSLEDSLKKSNAQQLTQIALSILHKKKFIHVAGNEYKLTLIGKKALDKYLRTSYKTTFSKKVKYIDDIRLEVLNLKYRKKRLKII